jgi:hypothetical protein
VDYTAELFDVAEIFLADFLSFCGVEVELVEALVEELVGAEYGLL